jgi:hypothetical protein
VCTATVSFTPLDAKVYSVTLEMGSSGAEITGTGFTAVPDIELSASSLGFPDTPVNAPSQPLAFTVTNTGIADRDITIAITNPQFTRISPPCATLAQDDVCDVSVTFTPSAVGFSNGNLRIVENMILLASASLTGTGTPSHYTLTLAVKGNGTVTVMGEDLSCNGSMETCVWLRPAGQELTLQASSSLFSNGWLGDCAVQFTPLLCDVQMTADRSVSASFPDN